MYELIEKLLKIKNATIRDIEKNTSISQQQINNWKQKKSKPSANALDELAKYFDIPISYFFTGRLTEENENFTDDDLLLARELNRSDKVELIKDIMKIQKEKDVEIIELITKKILESQG